MNQRKAKKFSDQNYFQFRFIDADDTMEITFPDKRFLDKAGLSLAWCFEIDIAFDEDVA